jgi:hypothetical protein
MVFTSLLLSVCEKKMKIKFILTSMKSLTYWENPSIILFWSFTIDSVTPKRCFRKQHVILKTVPKARHESTLEKSTMREKESQNRNLMWLSEQALELLRNFIFVLLSLTRQHTILTTNFACTKISD